LVVLGFWIYKFRFFIGALKIVIEGLSAISSIVAIEETKTKFISDFGAVT